jgi:hypothetical protein
MFEVGQKVWLNAEAAEQYGVFDRNESMRVLEIDYGITDDDYLYKVEWENGDKFDWYLLQEDLSADE